MVPQYQSVRPPALQSCYPPEFPWGPFPTPGASPQAAGFGMLMLPIPFPLPETVLAPAQHRPSVPPTALPCTLRKHACMHHLHRLALAAARPHHPRACCSMQLGWRRACPPHNASQASHPTRPHKWCPRAVCGTAAAAAGAAPHGSARGGCCCCHRGCSCSVRPPRRCTAPTQHSGCVGRRSGPRLPCAPACAQWPSMVQ